jgi:hypothetical protein
MRRLRDDVTVVSGGETLDNDTVRAPVRQEP